MIETTDHIITIYQELFRVKFLHEGYGGTSRPAISSAISVYPDTETGQLFNRHHMNFRFFEDLLICFIECDLFAAPAKKPRIPHIGFDEETRIRFNLGASVDFLKKTEIVAAGVKQVYQFSNKSNAGTNMFISQNEEAVNDDDLKDIALVEPDKKCFAVVDIYTNGTDSGYALFNANETLVDEEDFIDDEHNAENKPLEFQLRFRSRI